LACFCLLYFENNFVLFCSFVSEKTAGFIQVEDDFDSFDAEEFEGMETEPVATEPIKEELRFAKASNDFL